MEKLTLKDLMPPEQYEFLRADFHQYISIHKAKRQLSLTENATLLFEDRETVLYQIQEMLTLAHIFEPKEIQEELDAYNPLIPDGQNLKASLILTNAQELDLEKGLWLQIGNEKKCVAFYEKDLNRSSASSHTSVYYLRFELSPLMCAGLKEGLEVQIGVNCLEKTLLQPVPSEVIKALAKDIQSDYLTR